MKLRLFSLLSGLTCLTMLFTGCPGDKPAYDDAVRLDTLSVVPEASLNAPYIEQSPNPFLNGAYLVKDQTNFKVSVFNAAPAGQNRLELSGDNAAIAGDINDIDNLEIVVTTDDKGKLGKLLIEGQEITAGSFRDGVPLLSDGEQLDSGARLPGQYAIVKLPVGVKAGKSTDLNVSVIGAAGLTLHLEATGELWGRRVMVTPPQAGTTYQISLPPPTYTLSVVKNGVGHVGSTPQGIDCGLQCQAIYVEGTNVELTANELPGWEFTGWSGACSGTSETCTVAMNASKNVTANFTQLSYSLAVTKTGSGAAFGQVTSAPLGIDCGTQCSATYTHGTMVTLTASTDSAVAEFTGWGGACASAGASTECTVEIGAAQDVTANFELKSFNLTVNASGEGNVNSLPAGIDCGSTGAQCVAQYPYGTSVTLTASADAGAVFAGWTGACSSFGTNPVCAVTINADTQVGVDFGPTTHNLSVTVTGTGYGKVVATPAGIDCGSDCDQNYVYGSSVTLTVVPDPNSAFTVFTGWGGACASAGTLLSCTITITGDTVVSANLDEITQINIALNASKVYQAGQEFWGEYVMPQRGDLAIPAQITLSKGNTGNHVAAIDFDGTVCCYKGGSTADGKAYLFNKCIDGSNIGGVNLNSLAIFAACKDNTTPSLGVVAGDSVEVDRGGVITLLVENDDNRNPPPGSPNYEAIVSVVIDVLAWFMF